MVDEGLLRSYEGLLSAEEHAHMREGSTPAVRKERLLARVLVRTTLSRCALCASPCQTLVKYSCPACPPHKSPYAQGPHMLCPAQQELLGTSSCGANIGNVSSIISITRQAVTGRLGCLVLCL